MKSEMTREVFLDRMEAIDEELVRKGIPVFQRLIPAFHILAPSYSGEVFTSPAAAARFPDYVGPRLVKRISEWYSARYGARNHLPSVLARVPILIKGQVYLARIPLIYGAPGLGLGDVLGLIEGMTPSMAAALSHEEGVAVMEAWCEGFDRIYEIDDLRSMPTGSASPETLATARSFFDSALLDREAAARAFESPRGDLPTACFHAQQLAEKILKSFALLKGLASEETLKSKIGHKLKKLATLCETASPEFASVAKDVALLDDVPMDVRYTPAPMRPEEAAEKVWAALRIAGFTACQILGKERRSTQVFLSPTPLP